MLLRPNNYYSETKRISRATNFSVRKICRKISRMVNRKSHKEKPVSKKTGYFNFYLLPNPKKVITGNHIIAFFKNANHTGIANRTRLLLKEKEIITV